MYGMEVDVDVGCGCGCFEARERIERVGQSYLAGRDELQSAQRALQVGDIVLEVSQRLRSVSNAITRTEQLVGRLALAMLVSTSEGFCLDGLLGAILFSELDMLAADVELGRRFVGLSSWKVRRGRILVFGGWTVRSCKRGASLSLLHHSINAPGTNEQQNTIK
jgi:hypothetical protein